MIPSERARFGDAGVALLTALGLLVVFSILGTYYLSSMSVEDDKSELTLARIRARHVARGGIQAAISEIQRAMAAGETPKAGTIEIELPVYMPYREAASGFRTDESCRAVARVTIRDECTKVNINLAPTRVLEVMLGVDGDTARKIRSSLPRQDTEGGAVPGVERRWFVNVEELLTRGFLDAAKYDAVDKSLLTVYTVDDPDDAAGFININAAPAEVIAAVLNIGPEAAQAVVAARPFATLADLSATAGQDPAAFNVKPSPDAPDALPKELSFTSRCFRLIGKGVVAKFLPDGVSARATAAYSVEAVVTFTESGRPGIRYWTNESAGEPDITVPEGESEPERAPEAPEPEPAARAPEADQAEA